MIFVAELWYVFSANGAAFIHSLGQRPRETVDANHQRLRRDSLKR
jgi:hypothetical protein